MAALQFFQYGRAGPLRVALHYSARIGRPRADSEYSRDAGRD